jgi:hypothetical protein
MSLFEWVMTVTIIMALLIAWNIHRTLRNLMVQVVNEIGAIRAAVELTSRSYLGIESVWEAHHRTMGQFGGQIAQATSKDLPVLSGRRMGEIFAQMAADLTEIRQKMETMSGGSR